MKVLVRLQAQVRQVAGRPVVEVEVPPDSTIAEVVRTLAQTGAETLQRLLLTSQGRIQPTLLLFRGDEQVSSEDTINAGEELTLLTPMAGG